MKRALFAAVLCVAAGPLLAEGDDANAPEASIEAGAQAFAEACAGCHGAGATGDGPAGALLTVPVPDLTQLAARNGGVFDPVRVIQMVDGRQGLAAHGGPMPMFGGLLTGPSAVIDGADGTPVSTTAPILGITRWIETLQETTP